MQQGHSSKSPFYYPHTPSCDSSQNRQLSADSYSRETLSQGLEAPSGPDFNTQDKSVTSDQPQCSFTDPYDWCTLFTKPDTKGNSDSEHFEDQSLSVQAPEFDGTTEVPQADPMPCPFDWQNSYQLSNLSTDGSFEASETRVSVALDTRLLHSKVGDDRSTPSTPFSDASRTSLPPLSRGETRSPSAFFTPIEPSQPLLGIGIDLEPLPKASNEMDEACLPPLLQPGPATMPSAITLSPTVTPGSPPPEAQLQVTPHSGNIGGHGSASPSRNEFEFTFQACVGPAGEVPNPDEIQSPHLPAVDARATKLDASDKSPEGQETIFSVLKTPVKNSTGKKSSRQNKNVVKVLVTAEGRPASSLPNLRVRQAMGLKKVHSEYDCHFSGCREKVSDDDLPKHVESHLRRLNLPSGAACPLSKCRSTHKDMPARKRHILQAHFKAGKLHCEACGGSFSRVSFDQVIRHLETKPIKHGAVWKALGLELRTIAVADTSEEDHAKEKSVEDVVSDDNSIKLEFVEGTSKGNKRRRL